MGSYEVTTDGGTYQVDTEDPQSQGIPDAFLAGAKSAPGALVDTAEAAGHLALHPVQTVEDAGVLGTARTIGGLGSLTAGAISGGEAGAGLGALGGIFAPLTVPLGAAGGAALGGALGYMGFNKVDQAIENKDATQLIPTRQDVLNTAYLTGQGSVFGGAGELLKGGAKGVSALTGPQTEAGVNATVGKALGKYGITADQVDNAIAAQAANPLAASRTSAELLQSPELATLEQAMGTGPKSTEYAAAARARTEAADKLLNSVSTAENIREEATGQVVQDAWLSAKKAEKANVQELYSAIPKDVTVDTTDLKQLMRDASQKYYGAGSPDVPNGIQGRINYLNSENKNISPPYSGEVPAVPKLGEGISNDMERLFSNGTAFYHGSATPISGPMKVATLDELTQTGGHPTSLLGTYVTDRPEIAQMFAEASAGSGEGVISQLEATPQKSRVMAAEDFRKLFLEPSGTDWRDAINNPTILNRVNRYKSALLKQGYDSIIIPEANIQGWKELSGNTLIALDPGILNKAAAGLTIEGLQNARSHLGDMERIAVRAGNNQEAALAGTIKRGIADAIDNAPAGSEEWKTANAAYKNYADRFLNGPLAKIQSSVPSAVYGRILKNPEAAVQAADILKESPEAMGAIKDQIASDLSGMTDAAKAKFITNNQSELKTLLGKDFESLDAIRNDIRSRIDTQTLANPTRGSNTALKLSNVIQRAITGKDGTPNTGAWLALLKGAGFGGGYAAFISHPFIGVPLAAGAYGLKALKNRSAGLVQNSLYDALMHPENLSSVLKAKPSAGSVFSSALPQLAQRLPGGNAMLPMTPVPPQMAIGSQINLPAAARPQSQTQGKKTQSSSIPPAILDAVKQVESTGDTNAVGKPTKAGIAKGAYQLLDSTGKEYHDKLGIKEAYDPFNEPQARKIAAAYLEDLYGIFHNWPDAITAYHSGQGNVKRGTLGPEGKKYANSVYAELLKAG